jgi:microcystin degradation protein MlrC
MKPYFISFLVLFVALFSDCKQEKKLPRVAICGLANESSTFSPAQSTEESFRVRRGQEVFTYYPLFVPIYNRFTIPKELKNILQQNGNKLLPLIMF